MDGGLAELGVVQGRGRIEAQRLGVDPSCRVLHQHRLECGLINGQPDLAVSARADHHALPIDVEVLDLPVRVPNLKL